MPRKRSRRRIAEVRVSENKKNKKILKIKNEYRKRIHVLKRLKLRLQLKSQNAKFEKSKMAAKHCFLFTNDSSSAFKFDILTFEIQKCE